LNIASFVAVQNVQPAVPIKPREGLVSNVRMDSPELKKIRKVCSSIQAEELR